VLSLYLPRERGVCWGWLLVVFWVCWGVGCGVWCCWWVGLIRFKYVKVFFSGSAQRGIADILTNLRIEATLKVKDATENGFSKRPRYVIYIPSAEMKVHQNRIRSVKVRRHL